mmetsp:Transcript_123921/g.264209  ORF Transcript_123921/g.264209 Transcript_123921/m.264209 type:complete len:286 (-) Transcript_123921:2166-3023(-)
MAGQTGGLLLFARCLHQWSCPRGGVDLEEALEEFEAGSFRLLERACPQLLEASGKLLHGGVPHGGGAIGVVDLLATREESPNQRPGRRHRSHHFHIFDTTRHEAWRIAQHRGLPGGRRGRRHLGDTGTVTEARWPRQSYRAVAKDLDDLAGHRGVGEQDTHRRQCFCGRNWRIGRNLRQISVLVVHPCRAPRAAGEGQPKAAEVDALKGHSLAGACPHLGSPIAFSHSRNTFGCRHLGELIPLGLLPQCPGLVADHAESEAVLEHTSGPRVVAAQRLVAGECRCL